MRQVTKQSWISLSLLIMRAAANATEPTKPDARAVRDEISTYYADMVCKDGRMSAAFESHFWPGAMITTVWQAPGRQKPEVTTTSIDQFVSQSPSGACSEPVFEEKMTGARVRTRNGLAQVWAGYTARFGKPREVKQWKGVDAFTLLKHENRWKIASLVFRPD